MEKKEEQQQKAPAPKPCRSKKSGPDASFFQDVKEHFNEFVSASMEDHKNCFINTFGKMFKTTKEEAASASEPPVLATTSK